MSKIDVENVTISKWVILVGQNGISLLQKSRVDKFDIISARRWGVSHPSGLIQNLISHIPEMETFDLVLDDHVTTISYITPAVPYSGTAVTEENGTVIVQFYDILKSRACKLVSEKSHLDEMVEAFSPFFSRTRRIVLRGPTQDFRYIVYIETSLIVQKPKAWTGSIVSALSSVLLNRFHSKTDFPMDDAPKSVETALHDQPQVTQQQVAATTAHAEPAVVLNRESAHPALIEPTPFQGSTATELAQTALPEIAAMVAEPIVQVDPPTPFPKAAISVAGVAKHTMGATITTATGQATKSRDHTRKLTVIFSSSDDPSIALLTAGVVWSLPKVQLPTKRVSITEIGAYRKKLSSPFRRLVGVSVHHETDKLPIRPDEMKGLLLEISATSQQAGDHIVFFGYETLSTEMLMQISHFLQETPISYQIVVCHDTVAQTPELMAFETVFDRLENKSWIYLEIADDRAPRFPLSQWKTCKAPQLDEAVLKKVLDGEFRIFEKLPHGKSNLSILQSNIFARWMADFRACIAQD